MKRMYSLRGLIACSLVVLMTSVGQAQPPGMPKPTKEHELLRKFVGDWDTTATMVADPQQEAFTGQGHESANMVGGFWLVIDGEVNALGTTTKSLLTIGYDPKAKKYVGSFVCSADDTFWKYEGWMDESGKKLTLEAEGPSMLDPNKQAKYRDVIELKDKDHKVFTSYLQSDDGSWVKFVTMDGKRTNK